MTLCASLEDILWSGIERNEYYVGISVLIFLYNIALHCILWYCILMCFIVLSLHLTLIKVAINFNKCKSMYPRSLVLRCCASQSFMDDLHLHHTGRDKNIVICNTVLIEINCYNICYCVCLSLWWPLLPRTLILYIKVAKAEVSSPCYSHSLLIHSNFPLPFTYFSILYSSTLYNPRLLQGPEILEWSCRC